MQNAELILQAIRKLGEQNAPLTRVYRSLYSEDLYLAAYAKIYSNRGATTPGVDRADTVDGMSLKRISFPIFWRPLLIRKRNLPFSGMIAQS